MVMMGFCRGGELEVHGVSLLSAPLQKPPPLLSPPRLAPRRLFQAPWGC